MPAPSICTDCGHSCSQHAGSKCLWPDCPCKRYSPQLTEAQKRVLEMLATGCGAKAAAQALGLSYKTIEAHRFQMLRKFGLHSTIELITYCLQAGTLTLEPAGSERAVKALP